MGRRGRIPARGATPRQADALRIIGALTARYGYPPTLRELAGQMGIAEESAYELLLALRAKRLVVWRPGAARTLRLVGPKERKTWPGHATCFGEVKRRNRVALADGDVAGIEVQRSRNGRWLLFVWERGEHGCPLIGATITAKERARLAALVR